MIRAIILTGPSCSGKKQVGSFFKKQFQVKDEHYLEMGQLLRDLIQFKDKDEEFTRIYGHSAYSPLHLIQKSHPNLNQNFHDTPLSSSGENFLLKDWLTNCVNLGRLVPDFITFGTITKGIENAIKRANSHSTFIFDGYPRTPAAAQHLLKAFSRYKINLWHCFHLFIPFEVMLKRASERKRKDDGTQYLKDRYDFYLHSVIPAVEEMKKNLGHEKISLIDASFPHLENQDSIQKTIESCQKKLMI